MWDSRSLVPSLTPMPRTPVGLISLRHGYRLRKPWRSALNVRRVAALLPSQDLTGTSLGSEPAVLKGRHGGTDEFLGRGACAPQSPRPSGRGGRPLEKCLVQRHADADIRKSHAAVSEAVNRSPVVTPRKKKNLPDSAVRLLTEEAI